VYSLAWLVVVGVIGAVLGGWLGHLVARVRSKAGERIEDLEAELESARGEISEYRREVFDQFTETARKFRSLDESYNDLHRQLAKSASLLCGEAVGPLLEAPDPVVNEPDETDDETEADGEVPILVAEVSEPAPTNGESVAEAERAPRRADGPV